MSAQKRERIATNVITAVDRFNAQGDVINHKSENAVVGCVLRNFDLFAALSDLLQPADFGDLFNGYFWHSCEQLLVRGEALDIVTVANEMERHQTNITGDALVDRLSQIMGAAPDENHVEQYASEVRHAAMRIRTMRAADKVKALALDRAIMPEQFVDECNRLLFEATDQRIEKTSAIHDIASAYYDTMEAQKDGGGAARICTGLAPLDNVLHGFFDGEVTILAGSEGMGKTSLLLSMVLNAIQAGKRVALFTLEMTQDEIIRLLIAMLTGIPKDVLKTCTLNPTQWSKFVGAIDTVSKLPLHVIDEYPKLSPIQLTRKMRKLARTEEIDWIVIDGLWLMDANDPSGARFTDVSNIMRDLNIAARQFAPIMVAHQYTSEIDDAKRPTVYHLAESAGVRRNAQVVLGMYRETYFNTDELALEYMPQDPTKIYILKDRNGTAQGQYVTIWYDKPFARYRGGQHG